MVNSQQASDYATVKLLIRADEYRPSRCTKGRIRLSQSRPKRFSVWSANASRPRGESLANSPSRTPIASRKHVAPHSSAARCSICFQALDRRKLRQPILLVLSCTPPLRFAHGLNALPCSRGLTEIASESFKLAVSKDQGIPESPIGSERREPKIQF
jgi:hypothetical protein